MNQQSERKKTENDTISIEIRIPVLYTQVRKPESYDASRLNIYQDGLGEATYNVSDQLVLSYYFRARYRHAGFPVPHSGKPCDTNVSVENNTRSIVHRSIQYNNESTRTTKQPLMELRLITFTNP